MSFVYLYDSFDVVLLLYSKIGEKLFYLHFSHFNRMLFVMKKDIVFDPVDISAL